MKSPQQGKSSVCSRARDLGGDDHGAIMVMGIFMCLFLVGALWYIAGVGEALVYRERMQEASDAVAFSATVIEARGMNVIVMLNLLMAAILSIRVAINVVMYATIAASIVFTALGVALSWCGAGEVFLAMAEACDVFVSDVLKPLHDVVSPMVNTALEGLDLAEGGVKYATPVAAFAGGQAIAVKYEPTVVGVAPMLDAFIAGATVGTGSSPGHIGLPVEKGSTHKLCMKAFDGIKGVIGAVIGNGLASNIIGPIEGFIDAVGVSDLFCELGGGGAAPDPSKQMSSLGNDQCNSNGNIKQMCQQADDSQRSLDQLESSFGYVNGAPDPNKPLTPQQQNQVDAAQTKAQTDRQNCDNAKQNCQDGVKKATDKMPKVGGGGSGEGKEPYMVSTSWHNGSPDGQIVSVVKSDGKQATYSPKFVRIASRGQIPMKNPSALKGQLTSWSQSEFFYDCAGPWTAKACDADEEAMWNFRWRARFRLVNPSSLFLGQIIVPGAEAAMVAKLANDTIHTKWSLGSVSPAKVQFDRDVVGLVPPMSMNLH